MNTYRPVAALFAAATLLAAGPASADERVAYP